MIPCTKRPMTMSKIAINIIMFFANWNYNVRSVLLSIQYCIILSKYENVISIWDDIINGSLLHSNSWLYVTIFNNYVIASLCYYMCGERYCIYCWYKLRYKIIWIYYCKYHKVLYHLYKVIHVHYTCILTCGNLYIYG